MTSGTEALSDDISIQDEAPSEEALTPYDEAHMAIYLQLLYASAEGHGISRLAWEAFGIDARSDPERAQKIVSSHLRRAKWLSTDGRRHFLSPA